MSSNLSGFSHLAGKRTFMQQQQQEWRVIGGQEAYPNSWPWQVSVQFANMPACGGAILNQNWVLSATHCFLRYNKAFWTILAGKHDLTNPAEASQQIIRVSRIINHDGFNSRTKENDVSLLKLKKPLTFNNWVRPIDICGEALPINRSCTITGWGTTRENGNRVHKLHEVNVTVLPHLVCNKHYKGRMRPSMFCAGKVAGGADACQGDSGGPLSCMIDSRYQLAGLVSWGVGCGRANRPGVYVRLGQYLEWIAKVIALDVVAVTEAPCAKTAGKAAAPSLATLFQHMPSKHYQVGGVSRPHPHSWPWQVSLQDDHGHHFCSGVLLEDRWVLTARHCRVRVNQDAVVLGRHLGFRSSSAIPVKRVIHLPLEPDSTLFADLALLHLHSPARLGDEVTRVCIPDEDEELNDSWSCVTTGWGVVKAAEPLDPKQLHQVGLSLVNNTACRVQWEPGLVQESHICSHAAGSSSCLGDPAAPLFCRKNGAYLLFGILSFGSNSCGEDKPAVFTKVSDFESSISNEMRAP
ncbi:ovochymase-1 [Nelusetta ayraudi]|uniref:ovochymase-1 n=1 Tax=Nelusetta ayraudi TaxID=303726 RepID=UPI003F6FEA5C